MYFKPGNCLPGYFHRPTSAFVFNRRAQNVLFVLLLKIPTNLFLMVASETRSRRNRSVLFPHLRGSFWPTRDPVNHDWPPSAGTIRHLTGKPKFPIPRSCLSLQRGGGSAGPSFSVSVLCWGFGFISEVGCPLGNPSRSLGPFNPTLQWWYRERD